MVLDQDMVRTRVSNFCDRHMATSLWQRETHVQISTGTVTSSSPLSSDRVQFCLILVEKPTALFLFIKDFDFKQDPLVINHGLLGSPAMRERVLIAKPLKWIFPHLPWIFPGIFHGFSCIFSDFSLGIPCAVAMLRSAILRGWHVLKAPQRRHVARPGWTWRILSHESWIFLSHFPLNHFWDIMIDRGFLKEGYP